MRRQDWVLALILLLVLLFALWSRQGAVALEGPHLGWLVRAAPWPVVGIEPPGIVEIIDNTKLLVDNSVAPTCELGAVLMFTGKDGGPVTACHVGKLIEEKPGACAASMMSESKEKRAVREVWAREVYRPCSLREFIRMHASEFQGFERL